MPRIKGGWHFFATRFANTRHIVPVPLLRPNIGHQLGTPHRQSPRIFLIENWRTSSSLGCTILKGEVVWIWRLGHSLQSSVPNRPLCKDTQVVVNVRPLERSRKPKADPQCLPWVWSWHLVYFSGLYFSASLDQGLLVPQLGHRCIQRTCSSCCFGIPGMHRTSLLLQGYVPEAWEDKRSRVNSGLKFFHDTTRCILTCATLLATWLSDWLRPSPFFIWHSECGYCGSMCLLVWEMEDLTYDLSFRDLVW